MKTFRFLALALLALGVLASCSKENNNTPNGGNTPVAFAPTISGAQATTRASGTAWNNGDKIGVFMLNTGGTMPGGIVGEGTPAAADNVQYTNSASGFSTTTPIYYPQSGAVDFVAYYPWRAASASEPYIYKVDVATQTTPATIDLLYASKSNVAKSKTAVALEFDHKLSQIVLTVAKGTGVTDLSTMSITITDMPTKADFKLADGTFKTPTNVAVITPRTLKAGEKYDAIVIPQAASAWNGRKMIFTVGADVYEYAIPATDDFVSGKSYGYTVTIKKTSVSVSRGAITDWVTTKPEDFGKAVLQLPIMVFIPAGIFQMGSPDSEPGREYNEAQHEVTLTNDFYMSKYPITNAQYAVFLNATNVGADRKAIVADFGIQELIGARVWGLIWDTDKWVSQTVYDNNPTVVVTWFGAKAYADWAGGSLPTEAQWEYACRAGTTTAYSFGNDVTKIGYHAWYESNADRPQNIGAKLPNPWSLYDMHGNVWEWCSDWFRYDYGNNNQAATNPTGSAYGVHRVMRGGSWAQNAHNCRSAYRAYGVPDEGGYNVGFRVVFVP